MINRAQTAFFFIIELAVARGAAYFGMNPYKVATRVPRYWYGIDITNTFVPGVDPEEYKIIRADGSVRCDNRFSCFVPRGEPLGNVHGKDLLWRLCLHQLVFRHG